MKKYILIVAAFFTAGISGCKKDYLSLEVNPNAPSVTTPSLTLAAALNATAASVVNDYPAYGVWAGYWTTSGNYVPNQVINQFNLTTGTLNADWTDWYSQLTNYNTLETISSASPANANFQAIAIIMKAYGFQHLVDNFNDVPYSQAFQPSTILFPAYDKGSDIYEDLGKRLDAAIALIKANGSATSPGTADIVFGGDMSGWLKFANSLKLRLAIRVSTKNAADPLVASLAATQADGYIDGTISASANPGYQDINGKQNPFYGTYGFDASGNPIFGNVFWRANNFAVTLLTNLNDPRVGALYTQVPTSGTDPTLRIKGNVFGDIKALSNSYTSAIGPGLLQSATQGAVLFSGAESLFLQAEAANRGFITGDAQALYNAGVTASFESLGLTDAQATTYLNQPLANVNWAVSPDKETAILTQKWIALNGYFNFEAWNEIRRTGIPAVPPSVDPAAISTTFPTRVLYPTSELNTNPTNLAKEGTIDVFTSKIFWAK